jgi:hypothetical protein
MGDDPMALLGLEGALKHYYYYYVTLLPVGHTNNVASTVFGFSRTEK